jgi:hypothetical protein
MIACGGTAGIRFLGPLRLSRPLGALSTLSVVLRAQFDREERLRAE